ncbi:hypothetical protein AESSP_01597 [Aestuariimicrobium sp. T2.26MG-19.2B]|nr:hypothetical protein AESSP_01597 [Aestuariimicrobium sp. T2.26MG-19.2B]
MAKDIPADQFISLSDDVRTADPEHKWGLAPFHFVPAYHVEFLDRLAEISERIDHARAVSK